MISSSSPSENTVVEAEVVADDKAVALNLMRLSMQKVYQMSLLEAGMLLVEAWEASGRDFSDLIISLAKVAEQEKVSGSTERVADWETCSLLLREVAAVMKDMR